jgi:hypothetical protein
MVGGTECEESEMKVVSVVVLVLLQSIRAMKVVEI